VPETLTKPAANGADANSTDANGAASASANPFTPADAHALYSVETWSDGFFVVQESGNVGVRPLGTDEVTVDLAGVAAHLRAQGVAFPVLVRFQDILAARVRRINEAFRGAIAEADYEGRYVGVYPIKVNQLHEVVDEVLEAGRPYGMGLECGSKPELVAALPHLQDDETLLVCNGYKDDAMLRLMLLGQRLGKQVIPVVEKYHEFVRLRALAQEEGVPLSFGVRVRLAASGSGKWAESGGDQSKFGVSVPELLKIVRQLQDDDAPDALALLHFHLGSQIADVQALRRGVQEVTRIYAQLRARGLAVRYIDVGGGLGVQYEALAGGPSQGVNYTLSEYANAIVYTVQEVCADAGVPVPTLISESGRALTAHHSVLLVPALGLYRKLEAPEDYESSPGDHAVVQQLARTLDWAKEWDAEGSGTPRLAALLEAYHDASEARRQADTLFSFGYLDLEQKACAEQLFWSICYRIEARVKASGAEWLPEDLEHLSHLLTEQMLCDFSVFQSMLDHWAIGQRFPIMPVQRLGEEPTRRAQLVDLTCDSDGKVSHYVGEEPDQRYLPVHAPREGEPYDLAFFLMGAYQDIMGDAHNLFGRVAEAHIYADAEEPGGYYVEKIIPAMRVKDILAHVQYFVPDLRRRMERILRAKAKEGAIRPKEGVTLLDQYTALFDASTYLEGEGEGEKGGTEEGKR
jgi:arginine decarboxylase